MHTTKTIVLIHGNFVNNLTWTAWKKHYEAKGYTVHTPVNPGHDGEPAALRKNVHPDLVKTGFIDIVENLVSYDGRHGRPEIDGTW
jgi:esterase/lipase